MLSRSFTARFRYAYRARSVSELAADALAAWSPACIGTARDQSRPKGFAMNDEPINSPPSTKSRCCCGPEFWTGWPDPETKSMQPRCISDAHMHARELGRLLKSISDEDTQARLYRAFRAVVFKLRPGREGSRTIIGTRGCTFAFIKTLAIEMSPRPDLCTLNPESDNGE